MNEHHFWVVWNPDRGVPRFKHQSYPQAEAEAKRLAEANPGQRFYVLAPMAMAQRAEPVTVTRFRDDMDDEIPF